MEPGRGTMRDLVSEVDHGYLVWGCQGAHTSNVETGDFSFVASPGFLIERGAIVGCVRGAMISGNIMDLFSGIEKIGGDTMDCGNATQPSMLVGGVKITTG
jgi:PmbA protein